MGSLKGLVGRFLKRQPTLGETEVRPSPYKIPDMSAGYRTGPLYYFGCSGSLPPDYYALSDSQVLRDNPRLLPFKWECNYCGSLYKEFPEDKCTGCGAQVFTRLT